MWNATVMLSAMPMQYHNRSFNAICNHMPQHAIDKLWTTNLDVNLFLWMQTFYQNMMQAQIFIPRCKCFLQSCKCKILWCRCPLRRCKCNFLWCKFPTQGYECKVYSWWCKCPLTKMQMQMPPYGYTMMQMSFTRHKCNLNKNFFYFQIETSSEPETKMLSKLDLFFFIILVRLE